MLSRYERFEPIGRGGMGVVFRAVDAQLQRPVALKFLTTAALADREMRERFLREARLAAALNHPGICTIYEVGETRPGEEHLLGPHHGLPPETPFLAMEFIAGVTLEAELQRTGALPCDRIVRIALPIAEALAAAHLHRIVHRDLKPGNVMLLGDGRVKLLDFGLAKPLPAEFSTASSSEDAATLAAPPADLTTQGRILGTVAYMSPEQASGEPVDSRSDVFSFGVMLYEMATGRRPFEGSTPVSTLAKILESEPTPIGLLRSDLPPELARIIRRCLRKRPDERFNDTRDLVAALRDLQQESSPDLAPPSGSSPSVLSDRLPSALSGPASPSAQVSGPGWPSSRDSSSPNAASSGASQPAQPSALVIGAPAARQPSFRRLTYARGMVESARFAPGGAPIIYSARWRGGPPEIFTVRPESPESRAAGLERARLLSVSRTEELAIQRSPFIYMSTDHGRLARAPLGGSGVRDLLDRIQDADFAPDGRNLAILRVDRMRWIVELPAGTPLYQTHRPLAGLRFSPDGATLAVLAMADSRSEWTVRLVDRQGGDRPLAQCPPRVSGMAWSPSGRELCLSCTEAGGQSALWVASLEGERRLLWRGAGIVRLHDVAPDGRLLVSQEHQEQLVHARPPGSEAELELSWLDGSLVTDLSADGRTMLLSETGVGGGEDGCVYIRDTSGGPAIRIAEGTASSLSADGAWILVVPPDDRTRLDVVPTGAGIGRSCRIQGTTRINNAWLFPDRRRVLALDDGEQGLSISLFVADLETGGIERRFPEGTALWVGQHPVSPDGRFVALLGQTNDAPVNLVFPADGGEATAVPGLGPTDIVSGWTGDSAGLYVFNREGLPTIVDHVDVATGRRETRLRLMPEDIAGVRGVRSVRVSWGGGGYAYDFSRVLSELYVVEWQD